MSFCIENDYENMPILNFDVKNFCNGNTKNSQDFPSKNDFIEIICNKKLDDNFENETDTIIANLFINKTSKTSRNKSDKNTICNNVIQKNIQETTLPLALRKRLLLQRQAG